MWENETRSIDFGFSYQGKLEDGKQKRQCGSLKGVTVEVYFSKVFLVYSDEEDDWSLVSPCKGK